MGINDQKSWRVFNETCNQESCARKVHGAPECRWSLLVHLLHHHGHLGLHRGTHLGLLLLQEKRSQDHRNWTLWKCGIKRRQRQGAWVTHHSPRAELWRCDRRLPKAGEKHPRPTSFLLWFLDPLEKGFRESWRL